MSDAVLTRKARFYLSQLQFLEISRCMYEPDTPERDDLERRIVSARDLCMVAERPLNLAGWQLCRDGSLGRIVEVAA